MASPRYFQNFPAIQYAVRANKSGKIDYINIVDYFKMMRVREDILPEDSFYVPYTIQEGESPDMISYNEYDDEQFYWVILQVNNITDYYNQWPMTTRELEEHITKKYGSEVNSIHHYETVTTYTEDDKLILEGGIKVDSDFKFEYPSKQGSNVILTSFPVSVSNEAYERDLNEQKKEIEILSAKYISDYAREFRKYVSSQEPQKSEINISEVA